MFDLFKSMFQKGKGSKRSTEMSALERARIERARINHSQRKTATSRTSSPEDTTVNHLVFPDLYQTPYSPYSDSDSGSSTCDSGSSSFSSCD